jgi:hypothetical protein
MNKLRKYLGLVWLALAAAIGYYGFVVLGLPKLQSGKQEDFVFGIIVVFVLLPIVVYGLTKFGLYALGNEYDIHE